MNTSEVIQWLRQQSLRFKEMADEIELAFGTQINVGPISPQVSPNGTVDSQEVIKAMKGRSMRIASLAKQMNVTPEALENVMTDTNGFKLGDRGWYSHESIEVTE